MVRAEGQQRATLEVIAVGQLSALERIAKTQSDRMTTTDIDTTAYLLKVRFSTHPTFTAGETLVMSTSDALLSGSRSGPQWNENGGTDATAPAKRHGGTKAVGSMPGLAAWLCQSGVGWCSSIAVLWLALTYALVNAVLSGFNKSSITSSFTSLRILRCKATWTSSGDSLENTCRVMNQEPTG